MWGERDREAEEPQEIARPWRPKSDEVEIINQESQSSFQPRLFYLAAHSEKNTDVVIYYKI